MYCFSLFSLLYLFGLANLCEGLIECSDRQPCHQYMESGSETCESPGIWRDCMKTCNVCTGDHCNTGYVETSDGCMPCREIPLVQRLTYRECPQECPAGRWGPSCSWECSFGCYHQSCERWSGECFGGCLDGRYGKLCDLHCENC